MKYTPKLWIVTGCTVVGKTELSIRLARHLNAKILSCDSVQVYRGADIGSAKITHEERQGVQHYGIDLCDPDVAFDVALYQNYARSVIQEIAQESENLLVVGGTGFYLKSFFSNTTDDVVVPQEICDEVSSFFANHGIAALQEEIKSYGPVDLNNSDWNNPRRLCRILEKQRVLGVPQEKIKKKYLSQKNYFEEFPRKVICLERNKETLYRRIDERIAEMFRAGFFEEVCALNNHYGERLCLPLRTAIGYREVLDYLNRENNKAEKIASVDIFDLQKRIASATYRLVKKQKTWLKNQIPIHFSINLDRHSPNESFDIICSFCSNGRK